MTIRTTAYLYVQLFKYYIFFISGLFASFSLPPINLFPFIFFLSLPIFFLIKCRNWKEASIIGFLSAFGWFVFSLYWLSNALISWKNNNKDIKLVGPLSPDSCWNSSVKAWSEKNAEKHDGILAMYHDQALPVIKSMSFGKIVNVSLGLPIVRTSVDHGTALELSGTGNIKLDSLKEAFTVASKMI